MSDTVSKSWFIVFNNPADHGYVGEPEEVLERLETEWIEGHPTRTCAMTYCISAQGLPHVHLVVEDVKAMRFSAVKKSFPTAHLEPTKGNKEQAEDYINKKGKYEEKGEVIVCKRQYGEIKGAQGQRRDLGILQDLIEQGLKPNEIMDMNIAFRRYSGMIRDAYFYNAYKNMGTHREVNVVWHVGDSGSGKTYTYVRLEEEHPGDVYLASSYSTGWLDMYQGESILVLDEFRGQVPYSVLLSLLQGYRQQFHARYANIYGLWKEVHVCSILAPDQVYKRMVPEEDRYADPFDQLRNRINDIVYHYKDKKGEYKQYVLPMAKYESMTQLRDYSGYDVQFINLTNTDQLELEIPFH